MKMTLAYLRLKFFSAVYQSLFAQLGPIKGYFPTPDIAYFFKSTFDTGAQNWSTPDIPKLSF